MKKIFFSKVAILLAVVVIAITAFTLTAEAKSNTQAIELTTRSILLIDRSGSMEEQKSVDTIVSKLETASFDAVGYFDTEVSADCSFTGGGNSSICEAIDEAADAGFTHITVVTDGEQWPADYSALSIYSDLDLTIHLVEEDGETEEFINQLKGRLVNSNLKVVTPEGEEKVILSDYQAPIYTIEVPVVEEDTSEELNEGDKTFIQNLKEGYFPWWLVLLLAALIAALFDFIHEIITRRRNEEEKEPTGGNSTATAVASVPVPKPIPAKAVAHIAQGAHVLADFSGSMAAQQSETAKACMDAQKGSETVICFGDSVSEHSANELQGIQASGKTHGWEALEQASAKGWDEIVLVSDLGFNGKSFDENAFSKKFKKVTVVTPSNYYQLTLDELQRIADEVEVLPL